MTCSTGCSDGCCAIVGSKGGYKRVSYNADPLQCCLAQTATIGNFTCDPKYRNNTSEDCRQYLKKYCEEDNGGNYAGKICQEFCNQELVAGRATCDQAVKNSCTKLNPNQPNCKCYNPPENIKELKSKIDQDM